MGKRIFLLITALLTSAVCQAERCDLLEDLVESEVTAYVLKTPRQPFIDDMSANICRATALTVSRAYSKALASAGIHVSWSQTMIPRGDYCLSHDLSQCYPQRNPYTPPTFAGDLYFIADTWRAMQQVINRTINRKVEPDTSRFIGSQVRRGIREELRVLNPTAAVENSY